MYLSLNKIGLACLCLTLAACKKETVEDDKLPFVNFSFDKNTYTEGETIQLTSTSTDATTYRWTFPDGTTASGQTASYPIPKTASDRTLLFRLDAFSSSGSKTNYAVKSIPVKAITNKLIMYQSYNVNGLNYDISVDGNSLGTLNVSHSPITPNCNQTEFPNIDLKTGSHVVMYKPSNFFTYITKTIYINETGCSTLELQ